MALLEAPSSYALIGNYDFTAGTLMWVDMLSVKKISLKNITVLQDFRTKFDSDSL